VSIDGYWIDDLRILAWAANLTAIDLRVPPTFAEGFDRPNNVVFHLDSGPPIE